MFEQLADSESAFPYFGNHNPSKNYFKILSKMIRDAFKPFVIKPELQIDEKMF